MLRLFPSRSEPFPWPSTNCSLCLGSSGSALRLQGLSLLCTHETQSAHVRRELARLRHFLALHSRREQNQQGDHACPSEGLGHSSFAFFEKQNEGRAPPHAFSVGRPPKDCQSNKTPSLLQCKPEIELDFPSLISTLAFDSLYARSLSPRKLPLSSDGRIASFVFSSFNRSARFTFYFSRVRATKRVGLAAASREGSDAFRPLMRSA